MVNIKGKKLLILGSTELISTIVKKAKELGVYTIVTDNRTLDKAPAKKIADSYYNIDISDIEGIKKLVSDEGIDGVLTGFTDSYMSYYLQICRETGLPCYGDERPFEIATDKAAFKDACIDAGVPVIPGGYAGTFDETERLAKQIGFPLMIKPIDNSGSRGVIKSKSDKDLKDAYEYAMSFSAKKIVMVEKYLNCENIAVSYFAANGDIRLSTTDDRYVYKSPISGSSTASYSEYPSRYTERYIREVDEKVVNMLKQNGFAEGVISLQAFVDEKSFYFCEMCYRLSGGQHYLLVENQNGIDQFALIIQYAVTGRCYEQWDKDKETPWFNEKCAMLRIIGKPRERIAKLEGFNEIILRDEVIMAHNVLHEGDIIGKSGTIAQTIGNVLYKFSGNKDPKTVAESMLNELTIENEFGESIAWISID